MSKRKIFLGFLFAALAALVPAAHAAPCTLTQVTGTVTDPSGIPYAFGTVQVSLVPAPSGTPLCNGNAFSSPLGPPTQLSSTGSFALAIPSNTSITPSSTQWLFVVNQSPGVAPPFGVGPVSFSVAITITGATQSVTSTLTAAAVALTVPFSSGGGAPAGNVGDLQTKASSSTFGASHINDSGTALSVTENVLASASANIGLKYLIGDSFQFVDSAGNDANDGLSPGTPKLTVMAGYDALPSAGGTISICAAGGAFVNATATAGQGIWIAGGTDPNFSSLPAGWRQWKPVTFQGACGNNAPSEGSKALVNIGAGSSTASEIILSSIGGAAISFNNLMFGSFNSPIAVQLGVDSNGNQTSTSGVVGVSFDGFAAQASNHATSDGPAMLLGGGNTFNIYMRHMTLAGNATATPGSDQQAALVIHPSSGGADSAVGLIYIDNSTVVNGGIKLETGAQDGSSVTIKNLLSEGIIGPTTGTPIATVWATAPISNANIDVEQVVSADTSNLVVDVRIDSSFPINEEAGITCVGEFFAGIIGPCNLVGTMNLLQTDPLVQGQTGWINQRGFGFIGQANRQFGPTAVRFLNLAATSSASWTVSNNSGTNTITLGITAPDGTTGAAQVASTSTTQESVHFYNASTPLAVGDWFIGGLWEQLPPPGTHFTDVTSSDIINVAGSGNTTICNSLGTPDSVSGTWLWVYQICQVTAAVTSPAVVLENGTFAAIAGNAGGPLNVYAPILIHIPAAALVGANNGQDEAYEIANNLTSYNNSCAVGTICDLSGRTSIVTGTANQIDVTGSTISLDPQIVLSGATGGPQGTGTINTQGLFINGVAVNTGTVTQTGSPASTDCAFWSGTTTITGVSGCTEDSSGDVVALTIGTTGGANPGAITFPGNTGTPTVPSNLFGIEGPPSATFTSYYLQFPTTGPTNADPLLSCATPSSNISTCTWVARGGSATGCTSACSWYPFWNVPPFGTGGGQGLSSANQPMLLRFYLAYSQAATVISYNITAGSAASTGDVGVFGPCSTTCALAFDTGSQSTASTGLQSVTITQNTLSAGTYYLAFCDSSSSVQWATAPNISSSIATLGAAVAHTTGFDSTDTCTSGVLPSSITVANVTNSTGENAWPYVILSN
jgi:hypothetical protein